MNSARPSAAAERFLGVRLSAEELAALDLWKERSGSPTRSDAVRALARLAAHATPDLPELSVSLRTELDEVVADGFARDVASALEVVVTLGLQELTRVHAERVPALRRAARDAADRRKARRTADREGRGLLDR